MKTPIRCGAGLRPAILAFALALPALAQTKSGPCDRACLESFADQYMDALIAHDPKRLPLSPKLKNTENGQRLDPGDGFWRTATARASTGCSSTICNRAKSPSSPP